MSLKHKREKLVKKLTNKEYRDAWVDESVKTVIPYQIQAIRNRRNWSQEILGIKAGMMKPNAVSRLESMNYGNLSVSTLLRIAHGLDCGLLVKFVPFSRLVKEFEDVSTSALQVNSFSDDYGSLMAWTERAEEVNELEVKAESYKEYATETPSYPSNLINRNSNYSSDTVETNSTYVN